MKCSDVEIWLADYIDGTLASDLRAAVDEHASTCPACALFMEEAREGLAALSRFPAVEPPEDLLTRIAFQAPVGRARQVWEQPGLLSRLTSKWLQPLLQPKFAMGLAMTVISFGMLERCTGARVQDIQAADLSPVRVWDGIEDKAIRVRDRVVKYYENIRLVYEVESQLRQLEQAQDAAAQDNRRQGSGPGVNRSGKKAGEANAPEKRNQQ
ncbi:MAG: zf-HC2 domain-containing protein [Acidobacteriaceae bacterium]|nr:zf-HC2 domain-containing protein [Acidobacteriaceae bacterium]